jgi:hypothetical protein
MERQDEQVHDKVSYKQNNTVKGNCSDSCKILKPEYLDEYRKTTKRLSKDS